MMFENKLKMPTREQALKGRDDRMPVPAKHYVLDAPLQGTVPSGLERAMFGLGCFWGAERKFWRLPGVYTTAIVDAPEFYYAEDYHQQYLAKNPAGYCGLGGTGVSCPVGVAVKT